MSKTRDTGYLGNVIKVDNSGNVSFVSGSTTLATINTSGQLSGSSPALSASYSTNADTLASSFVAFSASYNAFSASVYGATSSLFAFSSSHNSYTSSLNLKTASFATTGSNNFTAVQHIADTTNPTGFDTTASLYTEGGFGIKKDTYISSSLYIKGNLTVYGTQSVSYITSSQLNISTNLITVNTATPSVRFGGLAVIDSGSASGLTGSLLWDSQNNNWLYSNPSGSGNYDSSMVIMGPRNSSTLGNEQGLSCNYLVLGHGSHHTTSSAIYHDNTVTCFYGQSFISSSGAVSLPTQLSIGTSSISYPLTINANTTQTSIALLSGYSNAATRNWGIATNALAYGDLNIAQSSTLGGDPFSGTSRMYLSAAGIVCFSCQVCSAGLRTTDSVVLLKNAATDNRYIQFCDTNTGGYRYDFILQGTASGCGFGLYNNNTAAWIMYSTPNGNIGLGGTTSPGGRLEVWQCTNNRLIIDCVNVQNEPRISSLDSANNPQYLTINSYDLKIKANGTEAMRITSGGYVGINTNSPQELLEIYRCSPGGMGGSIILNNSGTQVNNATSVIFNDSGIGSVGSIRGAIVVTTESGSPYYGDMALKLGQGTYACQCTIMTLIGCNQRVGIGTTTPGQKLAVNGTLSFRCMSQHPSGNWYKIPFQVSKNSLSGTASTFCMINITDNPDGFNEYFIYIDYASRLQGVSDSYTQVSSRMYGVNRFNFGTIAITDSYIFAGGSGCAINTHAPITAAVVGTCTVVVKVDFSSTISSSSFVWGEIRIHSIEALNNYLTIPYNEL